MKKHLINTAFPSILLIIFKFNFKNPYHFMWISIHFLPLSMVLRSAFPRYSTEAAAGLVSKKSVFASIMPAMAAPTAPRPSDHMPIASVSPSRTDDDTAGKICMGYMKHCFNNRVICGSQDVISFSRSTQVGKEYHFTQRVCLFFVFF